VKTLKRLELYFDDRQADLAFFSATLNVTIMAYLPNLRQLS
jgi:hypothetical protein